VKKGKKKQACRSVRKSLQTTRGSGGVGTREKREKEVKSGKTETGQNSRFSFLTSSGGQRGGGGTEGAGKGKRKKAQDSHLKYRKGEGRRSAIER